MSSLKETINAGTWREFFEPGDFFRLLVTTEPVTVEFYAQGRKLVDVVGIEAGYAEYFRGGTLQLFDRVRIYSATTQAVGFVTRFGSDVRYDRGASSVTGTVSLEPATLEALRPRPELYTPQAPVVMAAGVVPILLPGANVNGYIVQELQANGYASSFGPGTFLAKISAPTSLVDGDGLGVVGYSILSASNGISGRVQNIHIPAGKGIYFYGMAGSVYAANSAFITLVGKAL
jgi:hypothetical protein